MFFSEEVWALYPERMAQLGELNARIKPVMRFSDDGVPSIAGQLFFVKLQDRNGQHLWTPERERLAVGLAVLCDIETIHWRGYWGNFPRLSDEVIGQIPERMLLKTSAFEFLDSNIEFTSGTRKGVQISNQCWQATVRLFSC